jgi:hypothetical protein
MLLTHAVEPAPGGEQHGCHLLAGRRHAARLGDQVFVAVIAEQAGEHRGVGTALRHVAGEHQLSGALQRAGRLPGAPALLRLEHPQRRDHLHRVVFALHGERAIEQQGLQRLRCAGKLLGVAGVLEEGVVLQQRLDEGAGLGLRIAAGLDVLLREVGHFLACRRVVDARPLDPDGDQPIAVLTHEAPADFA